MQVRVYRRGMGLQVRHNNGIRDVGVRVMYTQQYTHGLSCRPIDPYVSVPIMWTIERVYTSQQLTIHMQTIERVMYGTARLSTIVAIENNRHF